MYQTDCSVLVEESYHSESSRVVVQVVQSCLSELSVLLSTTPQNHGRERRKESIRKRLETRKNPTDLCPSRAGGGSRVPVRASFDDPVRLTEDEGGEGGVDRGGERGLKDQVSGNRVEACEC